MTPRIMSVYSLMTLLLLLPTTVLGGNLDEIVIPTDFGDYAAAYFPAAGKHGVLFVPGARFDKESWYPLSQKLQDAEMPSLALDKISGPAMIGGIDILHNKGCESVVLVGGSRGAGVILTLPVHPLIEPEQAQLIRKMVLLAPFGGDGSERADIEKLFVIGEKDGLSYANTMRVFGASVPPKTLKVFPNTAYHAQHLFKTKYREELTALILDFIREK